MKKRIYEILEKAKKGYCIRFFGRDKKKKEKENNLPGMWEGD